MEALAIGLATIVPIAHVLLSTMGSGFVNGIPCLGIIPPIKTGVFHHEDHIKMGSLKEDTVMLATADKSVYHHANHGGRIAAVILKPAQLRDPQDLDCGVNPDGVHGLYILRSVMVHVDPPPPPPEPPP